MTEISPGCLRGYLLDYFGQPHAPRCENCGNCQAEYDLQDLTREAQMILSCVVRVRTRRILALLFVSRKEG